MRGELPLPFLFMRIPTFRAGRCVRTTAIALTVTAALAGGLTACSSDDSDSSNSSETGSASNQSDTIEIEHIMGTTEVPTNPETIASFSPAFTDAFAALGRPVDVEFRASGFDAEVPWSGEAPGTLESYSTGADGIGAVTEEIAAADPDVIFASWLPDEATYDKLNAIAPTVAVIGENPSTDDWRMSTEIAGEVIGKADEAKDLVADAEQAIADARDSHPALGGATAAFGQASPQGTAVVTADEDPANVFLTNLGMVIPEEIKEVSEEGGRAFISDENSDLLNTDFLAMWNAGTDAADTINGWDDLKAVQDGTSVTFDTVEALALSQPSILAVPWLVEHLEPQFAALDAAAE